VILAAGSVIHAARGEQRLAEFGGFVRNDAGHRNYLCNWAACDVGGSILLQVSYSSESDFRSRRRICRPGRAWRNLLGVFLLVPAIVSAMNRAIT